MNLYAYVGNDPVNFVDPLGLAQTRNCPSGYLQASYDPVLNVLYCRRVIGGSDLIIVTGRRGRAPPGTFPDNDGHGPREPGASPDVGEDAESKACQILQSNSEASKGILPEYLTNNKNWNNPSTLLGYRNFYKSNSKQWSFIASRPVQYSVALGLAFAPGIKLSTRILGALGGAGFSDLATTQLQLNDDKVKAINDRLKVIGSGCGENQE